jgi:exosortase
MLWARSSELRQAPRGADYLSGTLLTATGIILLLIGHLGAVEAVEAASLVITALGTTLLLFGRHVFRIAWFPIMYLMLGIPVWDRVVAELQVPSQQLSANLAVRMLRLAGIPAIQDRTFVGLPNVTLEVLRECSGVNQLITLVTMAAAAAYIWLKSYQRRIVLLALSVIVAYLSNGARIALVGVLSYKNLGGAPSGVLHLLEGLAVSLAGYAVIFCCLSVLSKTDPIRLRRDRLESTLLPAAATERSALPRLAAFDLAFVTLLLCAALFRATFHAPAVRLNSDLGGFPAQIHNWSADPTLASATAFRLLGADNELVRIYRHSDGETIRLYVGYLQNQTEGKELRPPTVELKPAVHQLPDGAQTGMLFWYDVNGRVLSNLFAAKAYTVWDALTRRRTNAAVVMIQWTSGSPDHIEHSRERVREFADALVPLLRDYFPSSHDADGGAPP